MAAGVDPRENVAFLQATKRFARVYTRGHRLYNPVNRDNA
jgi:hypothetical protein